MEESKSWEYEDFELDNRETNLMRTICGDFKGKMDFSEKTDLSKNIALYFGIAAGGRRKHSNCLPETIVHTIWKS